ncbi:MAG TPA: ABC transporter substrate-binding protein [Aggregatilineales bacterium]|nr:ABC transporter substrate-binding protein [Aggregatilineales bacterium]
MKAKYRPNVVFCLVVLLAVVACSAASPTSTPVKVFKVGILGFTGSQASDFAALRAGLADQGFVEGQNITYVYQIPASPDKVADSANALVAQNVDLVYGWGRVEGLALKATKTMVPVVFGASYMPVEFGLVPALDHPGGNVTGAVITNSAARRLQLLTQMDSNVHNVLLPFKPDDPLAAAMVVSIKDVAPNLNVNLVIANMTDSASAADVMTNAPSNIDALFLLPDRLTLANYRPWLSQASIRNIPVSTFVGLFVTNDYLMAYGPDNTSQSMQSAHVISQILKGSNPGDLPVEPVDQYLAINLDIAQRLNITVPDSILQQAKVIVRPGSATPAATK